MEIRHGLVGILSDTAGQTHPSQLPLQEDSVVHPVTYMQMGKMILILAAFSALRKYLVSSHGGIPFISSPVTFDLTEGNRLM